MMTAVASRIVSLSTDPSAKNVLSVASNTALRVSFSTNVSCSVAFLEFAQEDVSQLFPAKSHLISLFECCCLGTKGGAK